eukprot:m.1379817 g.1379817  ORF g.1379817 m.1379817 type:complete len:90 (-) comp24968_c0_seq4:295-564(-)
MSVIPSFEDIAAPLILSPVQQASVSLFLGCSAVIMTVMPSIEFVESAGFSTVVALTELVASDMARRAKKNLYDNVSAKPMYVMSALMGR